MNEPTPSANDPELFRIAVDLSPAGILAVDEAGTILLVNREIERLFGYERSELIGQPVERLIPDRFRVAHPGLRANYQRDPSARPMGAGRDLYGRRKDGVEIPIEIGLNPVPTGAGRVIVASVVDISARRQMEHQLRQSQKLDAVGTMASGIAHDFNNILFAITGHSELALSQLEPGSQVRADLEQVLRASERGRLLVRRLLAFSRRDEVARTPLALERPVREALELLRASLPSTIEIRSSFDAATPPVLSDETQVHQIVMNLATNAAHAMPGGGLLEVTLAPFLVTGAFAATRPALRPGPHARLRVHDTGAGMPPEVVERAFEPFFTTKPPGEGSGLGLSVIHGIVRGHGGSVEISSAPERGTTIDILLPASSAATGEDPTGTGTAPRKQHILLVEDEVGLAAMERRLIEALGYAVTVFTSSVEALETFRGRPGDFDLLVTDNTMPRLTGLALAQEVRKIRPDLKVLMVSGLAETSDPAQMRERGIHGMLRKPHTARELDAAIRALIGGE